MQEILKSDEESKKVYVYPEVLEYGSVINLTGS
jgi:hypothetical protein